MTIEQIIVGLMPFIIYGVTELVKYFKPRITGVALLIFTSTSSAILALVAGIVVSPDAGFLTMFAVNMLTVVVNQFYKQWQSGN